MQRRNVWFVTLVLLLALAAISPALAAPEGPMAPLLSGRTPQALPGRYIVVFKGAAAPGLVDAAMEPRCRIRRPMPMRSLRRCPPRRRLGRLSLRCGAQRLCARPFSACGRSTAAQSPRRLCPGRLGRHPRHHADGRYLGPGPDRSAGSAAQRRLPYDYTGAGVTAYIIDTGILFNHTQFGGRAVSGYDAVDGGSADDCNGHGTHVAGTVGGSTYGVAKGVSLVAVRVLDCSGSGDFGRGRRRQLGDLQPPGRAAGGGEHESGRRP